MAPSNDLKATSIIVGIDFGTTFSGISWALVASPDNIHVVRKWPSGGNRTSDKVPSEISYANGVIRWGFEVQNDPQRIKWMKLLLDDHPDRVGSVMSHNASTAYFPNGKDNVQIIADYLECLRLHLDDVLNQHFGKGFLRISKKKYLFTVPAVWSDKAKDLTRRAACLAGFAGHDAIDNLLFVAEPEAAALHTLKSLQPNKLKVGDNFVIADCGGGTVDLISYEIKTLEPRFHVEESAIGTGSLCGSVYLNHNFENLVRTRLGEEKFKTITPKAHATMISYFDEFAKRQFSDDEDEEIFNVPLPGVPDYPDLGIEEGYFVLTREDMQEIFDPLIKQIMNLVRGQVGFIKDSEKNVAAVLLAGGFGANEYLVAHLEAWATNEHDSKIEIMQPPDSWTSVVRGAVHCGLEYYNVVSSRRARRNYGVAFSAIFIDGTHNEARRIWDPIREEYLCNGLINWVIKKGTKCSDKSVFRSMPFIFEISAEEYETERYNTVANGHKLLALDDGHSDDLPRYCDSQGIYDTCNLHTRIDKIPKELWVPDHTIKSGKKYYRLPVNFVMTVMSANIKFELETYGERYGSVETKFV